MIDNFEEFKRVKLDNMLANLYPWVCVDHIFLCQDVSLDSPRVNKMLHLAIFEMNQPIYFFSQSVTNLHVISTVIIEKMY